MAQLLDTGIFSIVDTDGSIGVGWKLNFYTTGTSSRKPTYPTSADADAATNANANPVIVGSDGRVPAIWLTSGDYKLVVTDENDVVKKTADPAVAQALSQVPAILTIVNTTGNWLNAIVFSEGVGYDTYNSVAQQPLTVNSTTTHTVPRVAESVEMNALGSGANGPARADIGRSVFIGKDNYPTSGNIGEIDGLTINVRQRNGDCSGVLIDSRSVSGSSADFNACFEGVAWQTDSAGAGVSSIRAFAGINSGTGGTDGMPIKGFAATATSGSGQVGYYVAQSGGTFASAFRYDDFGGHNVFMVLGDGTPTVGNKGTAASRYFDFYTSGVTTNYDVRLAASGGTSTDGKGTLTVVANYLMLGAGGIGLTLPEVAIGNVTTPASGFATIFVDAADKKPKIKDSTGTVTAFF